MNTTATADAPQTVNETTTSEPKPIVRPKPLKLGDKPRGTNFGVDGQPLALIEIGTQQACFGRAYGVYRIVDRDTNDHDSIHFQDQPLEKGITGWTNESLVAIVKDRLLGFQSGPTPSDFNEEAIRGLEIFEAAMLARVADRNARGVRGEHEAK